MWTRVSVYVSVKPTAIFTKCLISQSFYEIATDILFYYCNGFTNFAFAYIISDIVINKLRVTSLYSYELRLLHDWRARIYFYCTSHELLFDTSYKLLLLHELQVTFYMRFTSCFYFASYEPLLDASYELLFIPRVAFYLWVTSCFYFTSYEILFTYELQVTFDCANYELFLAYELRVTVYWTSYELLFICEMLVTVYCSSYELHFNNELR